MEDTKVFDAYFELPEGYQVQLMVLQDYPGGRAKRGVRMDVFRSRIWIGNEAETEPVLHKSQEHNDLPIAIDACYSMALNSARTVIDSPAALERLQERVHEYFCGSKTAI